MSLCSRTLLSVLAFHRFLHPAPLSFLVSPFLAFLPLSLFHTRKGANIYCALLSLTLRGGVTRQGVVLADFQSLLIVNKLLSHRLDTL